MRAVLAFGALSLALCGTAGANDIGFAKDVGGAHLTGTVEIDDSSGDILSITGEASGAVSGKYSLDRVNIDAEVEGEKLLLHFDRRNQQISARLDGGDAVIVWAKP